LAIDLISPDGVSVDVLYIIPIYVSVFAERQIIFYWAAVVTVFSASESFISIEGGLPVTRELADRLLTIAVLWISAAIVWQLRQQRQIALREREAARKAAKMNERFLAAASHDLRQPVQSIVLLMAGLSGAILGDAQRQMFTHLERSVELLRSLLDGLFEMARLDAGTDTPHIAPLALDSVFQDVSAACAPVAESKGLEFTVTVDKDCTVRSDPLLLGRMVRNLVDNAIRYTTSGFVHVLGRRDGNMVRIEVRDSGIGIPPDQLHRIFQEFVQIDNAGRGKAPGLGLGLSIVHRLSGLLDHPLEVHSEPGCGTVFAILVPPGAPRE
jgi:signal transduction histidine kinase